MTRETRAPRRGALVALGAAAALTLTGCGSWGGLNSLSIPGGQGRGDDAYQVRIEMPNVTSLTENSPVLVNDVTVGRVDKIEVENWHALVTVSLNGDVRLPRNAQAAVGQTSLLGSQHIELRTPSTEPAVGRLASGDTIELSRAGQYPTTEETLATLSTVLSDGGLGQIQEITGELNSLMGGREGELRRLTGQVDDLMRGLNRQRGDIVQAMEGLDNLSARANAQSDVLERALRDLPRAIALLADQRENLVSALVQMGRLSEQGNRVIRASRADIESELRALEPTLRALADSGNHLTGVLRILVTFPFPQDAIDRFIRGDYANLYIEYDLTVETLRQGMLLGTPLGNDVAVSQAIFGRPTTMRDNPGDVFAPPGQRPPAPGLPSIPGIPEIPGVTAPPPAGPPNGGN